MTLCFVEMVLIFVDVKALRLMFCCPIIPTKTTPVSACIFFNSTLAWAAKVIGLFYLIVSQLCLFIMVLFSTILKKKMYVCI